MKKNMTSNGNSDFELLLYTTQTKVFRKKKKQFDAIRNIYQ